jgi:hypothetical protein
LFIGGVMVFMLTLSVVDCGLSSDQEEEDQTKDYEIGICFFSAKHAELRGKSKDCLTRNRDNVSKWSDMSTHG